MPGRDRSGPLGQGPGTGRGMGGCRKPAGMNQLARDATYSPPAPRGWQVWGAIFGRIFRRGGGNRINR
jgi:hypothetical protein